MSWKLLVVVMAAWASGCATFVKSGNQDISIESTPDQAEYEIRKAGSQRVLRTGTTPATVSLDRGDGYFDGAEYEVTIKKEGHAPQTVDILSSVNGWYAGGNILIGGLIGWLVVDPATGAMWNLEPENINAGLAATSYSAPPTAAPGAPSGAVPPTAGLVLQTGGRAVVRRETMFYQRSDSGDASKRALLPAGTAVELKTTRTDGGHVWWWVQVGERQGWVLASDLEPSAS